MADLVSARGATREDLEFTATLESLAAVHVRGERGGRWHLDHDADPTPAVERHQTLLQASDATVVVGCVDDVVVGYGLGSLSPTTSGQLCMIEELIVHPDARSIGVGSAILDELRQWAIGHRCQAIESQVLPGNRAAKNFFERVGMKTRKMRVSADL